MQRAQGASGPVGLPGVRGPQGASGRRGPQPTPAELVAKVRQAAFDISPRTLANTPSVPARQAEEPLLLRAAVTTDITEAAGQPRQRPVDRLTVAQR